MRKAAVHPKLMAKNWAISGFCAIFSLYLAFHALHGEQGLYAFFTELHRRDRLQEELYTTKNERMALESKVSRLRDDSLDPDLLDEEARKNLGMAGSDEIILLRKNQ
ncbi:MAG: septum formation initiator family protein [Rickettsiales bacterium]